VDCNSEAMLNFMQNKLGGGATTFNLIPDWLKPYLVNFKIKAEEFCMPSQDELEEHVKKQQKKAKKRGYAYVTEWVPEPTPAKQMKTKAERELRNDPFSTFFASIDDSGGKRSRRANNRYSSADTSEEDNIEVKKESEAETVKINVNTGQVKTEVVATEAATNKPKVAKDENAANQVAEVKSKISSKDKINAYLRTAGVNRQIPESTSVVRQSPSPPHKGEDDDKDKVTSATLQRPKRGQTEVTLKIETVSKEGTSPTTITRPPRHRNLSSKEVIKNDKCDTPSPSTKPSLTKQRVQSASDKLDSELEATEAETKAVLADLSKKKEMKKQQDNLHNQSLDEFFGWEMNDITSVTTAVSTCLADEADTQLDQFGVTFGIEEKHILSNKILCGSSEEVVCDLEINMSEPIKCDVKAIRLKARSLSQTEEKSPATAVASPTTVVASPTTAVAPGGDMLKGGKESLLRSVKNDVDLRTGSDGSDSDDKGSLSPVSSEVELTAAQKPSVTGKPPVLEGREKRVGVKRRVSNHTPATASPAHKKLKSS
jgi:hypothetical protein